MEDCLNVKQASVSLLPSNLQESSDSVMTQTLKEQAGRGCSGTARITSSSDRILRPSYKMEFDVYVPGKQACLRQTFSENANAVSRGSVL